MSESAARTALVLRHDETIHLGNLLPVLAEHGYSVVVVDTPGADFDAIDPAAADLLIVLGGDMGVYESEEHPYLVDEIALIRARIDAERPVFGVCLGAQLMAERSAAASTRARAMRSATAASNRPRRAPILRSATSWASP